MRHSGAIAVSCIDVIEENYEDSLDVAQRSKRNCAPNAPRHVSSAAWWTEPAAPSWPISLFAASRSADSSELTFDGFENPLTVSDSLALTILALSIWPLDRPRSTRCAYREMVSMHPHSVAVPLVNLTIGQRIQVGGDRATVRYIGTVEGQSGEWAGLEWDDAARGKHNGTVGGRSYFRCSFAGERQLSPHDHRRC